MHTVVERCPEGISLTDDSGHQTLVSESDFSRAVAVREAGSDRPRWVWSDTAKWYPALLAAGVRIERCHDLRLVDGLLCGIAGQVSQHEWGSAPRPALANTLFNFAAVPDAVA
jgi:DNA polymerase-1